MDRCSVRIGPEDVDAQIGESAGWTCGNRRSVEADVLDPLEVRPVKFGWSSRLVIEERRPAPIDHALALHQFQHPALGRTRRTGRPARPRITGIGNAPTMPMEAADRGGGDLAAAVGRIVGQQLAGLAAQRLVDSWTTPWGYRGWCRR